MISSRTLLFALLGLNLLVFLVLADILPGAGPGERDPARIERQIAPDKLERIRPSSDASSQSSLETSPAVAPIAPTPPSVAAAANGADGASTGGWPQAMPDDFVSPGRADTIGVPGLGAAADQLARGAGAPLTGVPDPSTNTALRINSDPVPAPPAPSRTRAPEAPDTFVTRENCVLFPETDYLSARRQLEQFAPSLARTSLKRLDAGSYLVFLDPLLSKEAAEQRRDELVAAGFSTAQVITSGLLKNGVQLGLVRTAEAAENRRRELLEQGLDEAYIGPLSVTTSRYQARMWADTALIEQSVKPAARQAGLSLEPCE